MTSSSALGIVTYRLNAKDEIISLGGDWDTFAADNQAPCLTEEAVKGRPLLEFFSGREIRHLYQIILDKVRQMNVQLAIPFRCDAPQFRRFFELTITAESHGEISFSSRSLRVEERPNQALLDSGLERTEELVTLCSWCKEVKIGNRWLEIEAALAHSTLLLSRKLPGLTHGICEECERKVLDDIDF